MTLTTIRNAGFGDLVDGVRYLLRKSKVSSEVQNLALEITASSYDKITDIYKFVKEHMSYESDPNGDELFISPVKQVEYYRTGHVLKGDCDDFALFITGLFLSIGLNSHLSIVATKPNEGWDHAISEVYSDKLQRFVQIDASTDKIPLGWTSTFYQKYDIE
jgi:predicted transglutaminase-like cysteine proteinase